ncbi:unnamed protein product [Mytilus coruscus]|uniref:G-protein coupled receptors family 1 profile domain-containing protein n=1 Tax=Mytilus coruscus TaxID=42192 RepID=A0A6J8BFW3_MYTCO|nr:unnamed protein product [Mytilus coruscus]
MSASDNSLDTSFTNISSVSISLAETDQKNTSPGTDQKNTSTGTDQKNTSTGTDQKNTSNGNQKNSSTGTDKEYTFTNGIVPERPRNKSKPEERISAAKRFSLMIIIINVVFILCYIPQLVSLFSLIYYRHFFISRTEDMVSVFTFIDQMVIINNCVNPFVYGMFDRRFRVEAKTLMCTYCKLRNN